MLKLLRDLRNGIFGSDRVLGIDLGTTNTVIAYLEAGKPIIVQMETGRELIPSVVSFQADGTHIVGDAAVRNAPLNPAKTIYSAKRFMGKEFNDVKGIWQNFPYVIRPGYNKVGLGFEIDGRLVSPQEVSALVLIEAKNAAESRLKEKFSKAVITVPAYFSDRQRQATKDAGAIAGLDVIAIISEPTAAALAYSEFIEENQTIVVFDLGGGTFDISLLKITENDIEVIATGGDAFLGGDNFSEALQAVVAQAFYQEHGVDVMQSPQAKARLKEAVERAKIELSSLAKVEISLPFIIQSPSGQPLNLFFEITKDRYESLIKPFLDRASAELKRTIEASGIDKSKIDHCLLVGGATRTPAVQKIVESFFGKAPLKNIHTDTIVAMGAALFGGIKKENAETRQLRDVTSQALGVQTYPDSFSTLIEKDSQIPCESKPQAFTTIRDGQQTAKINVYQGLPDPVASKNVLLGTLELEGLDPNAKAGTPKIMITYRLDADCILSVHAVDERTGKEAKVTLKGVAKLEKGEIKRAAAEAALPAEDKKQLAEARKELKEALEEVKEEIKEAASEDEKANLLVKVEEGNRILQEELSTSKIEKLADGIKEYIES